MILSVISIITRNPRFMTSGHVEFDMTELLSVLTYLSSTPTIPFSATKLHRDGDDPAGEQARDHVVV